MKVLRGSRFAKSRFAKEFWFRSRKTRREARSVHEVREHRARKCDAEMNQNNEQKYPVTIAGRLHLFPSRTQKLSSQTLMILGG